MGWIYTYSLLGLCSFFLPYGTKVVNINGKRFKYTKQTDVTPREGHGPFGIELK